MTGLVKEEGLLMAYFLKDPVERGTKEEIGYQKMLHHKAQAMIHHLIFPETSSWER